MTIQFYLKYHTEYGQSIYISGNQDFFGNADPAEAFPMTYHDKDYWKATLELPDEFDGHIQYKYIVRHADGFQIFDGEEDRFIDLSRKGRPAHLTVLDAWNDAGNINNIFFSKAFKKVLLPPVYQPNGKITGAYTHEFRVKAPSLGKDETVCMSGSTTHLGNWDSENPILLSPEKNWFIVRLKMKDNEWPAAYKYGIFNTATKQLKAWEEGENRLLRHQEADHNKVIIQDGFVNTPQHLWKGAGISTPVFSLRTNKGFGTGEFTDIRILIDWGVKMGIKLIQLLPINDTTALRNWRDSYPYAAISSFALHPLYINLDKVAGKKHAAIVKPLKRKQKQLNKEALVDYEQVMRFKWAALREIFELAKGDLAKDKQYFGFFEMNRHWLVPYAAFSYLRDKYSTPDFSKWKKYAVYDEEAIQKLAAPGKKHYDDIAFHYFVQYHLHKQLKEVVQYAHKHNIILKGDIPIGISRYSSDAWVKPSLYNINEQAGAPPDAFSTLGQNWGFPTYNWEKMKLDHFEWWRERFDQLSNYFDAFRIDHILGFFRIWSIPMHAIYGVMGRFEPALPVYKNEFYDRHITFDRNRYCQPYITDEILSRDFGEDAEAVIDTLLTASDGGSYTLNPEVNTQRKAVAYLDKIGKPEWKKAVLNLISNVILFVDEHNSDVFHFRVDMQHTDSFKALDEHSRHELDQLYINYFYHRQDHFWKKKAMNKLPRLKSSTNMLVCGEDLGMVPHCVPEVMSMLGILSLEIERMPKNHWSEFFNTADAPYLSVVTPSTHDMSTTREWWQEDRERTQKYYNQMMGHYGEAPEICAPWISREIIQRYLKAPAMWSIFQIQDILAMDELLRPENPAEERINQPSDPDHYWRYRMHTGLEQLVKNQEFNDRMKNFVIESGRFSTDKST